MSDMEEFHAAMKPLTKANVATVMATLEALLEALPAAAKDDKDASLRHDIEVLLAGYKAGTPRQRPKPPVTD
jgi:hypothetical protein